MFIVFLLLLSIFLLGRTVAFTLWGMMEVRVSSEQQGVMAGPFGLLNNPPAPSPSAPCKTCASPMIQKTLSTCFSRAQLRRQWSHTNPWEVTVFQLRGLSPHRLPAWWAGLSTPCWFRLRPPQAAHDVYKEEPEDLAYTARRWIRGGFYLILRTRLGWKYPRTLRYIYKQSVSLTISW